ncbi:hypothetical protein FHY55_07005 [Oceanicola sp. D3]|uniref:DUF6985 domain-containing protein n=1 Tax=Oceanicola sp. D3 TaxID=2587163 RepID=UPI00112041F9|nr:hypothetical protein [Oceanicola sp. D3]QDC09007.1 hypothetical protein FHY55_07005 [Oceanicola sp. D3]
MTEPLPTTLALPYFDGAEVKVLDLGPPVSPAPEEATRALTAFLQLTPQDRLADSLHVYNYYLDFHQAVGGEDWLDDEMGIPESPEDIWSHVTPGTIHLTDDPRHPGHVFLVMEANCAWEQEHGLMMIWQDGTALTKTGGYDGHVTNETAYAKPELAGTVYAATNPALTTRR